MPQHCGNGCRGCRGSVISALIRSCGAHLLPHKRSKTQGTVEDVDFLAPGESLKAFKMSARLKVRADLPPLLCGPAGSPACAQGKCLQDTKLPLPSACVQTLSSKNSKAHASYRQVLVPGMEMTKCRQALQMNKLHKPCLALRKGRRTRRGAHSWLTRGRRQAAVAWPPWWMAAAPSRPAASGPLALPPAAPLAPGRASSSRSPGPPEPPHKAWCIGSHESCRS